ncbi:hypothetical protein DPMN_107423 [Dreissena polymorpha]|uniref:Uncharacterized protein n=1 Tax=Dreissena polymorpha TaxID=45954 RepID=A0A9D4QK53_DREPO|nr:hypothetical protein DPMN_107423 [Dreissena polymorpha]
MVNRMTNTSSVITMNVEKLEEVTGFRYLGATLPQDSTSATEVRIRISMAD